VTQLINSVGIYNLNMLNIEPKTDYTLRKEPDMKKHGVYVALFDRGNTRNSELGMEKPVIELYATTPQAPIELIVQLSGLLLSEIENKLNQMNSKDGNKMLIALYIPNNFSIPIEEMLSGRYNFSACNSNDATGYILQKKTPEEI
jgi:hypothetical protein